ncbi:MAG: septum formation initiator family protein [Anaerolineaceae bacterium]|nr:septum formation initiator family protein [Anaerolineaceae bacterium]
MQKFLNWLKSIKINTRRLILIAVIALLVFMMLDFNNRTRTMYELEAQKVMLQTKEVLLQQTKDKLEAQIAYATSAQALEEWAREKNKQINAGDIPIILSAPENNTPTLEILPTPQTLYFSNWQIWQEFIFGH